jgi:hypothetical protein
MLAAFVSPHLPAHRSCSSQPTNRPIVQVEARKQALSKRTPAFYYRNSKKLSRTNYLSATTLRSYDGGGYAHDFDVKNRTSFEEISNLLREASWVDGATRVIVVEISLYSPPTDLLATTFFMVRSLSRCHALDGLLTTCGHWPDTLAGCSRHPPQVQLTFSGRGSWLGPRDPSRRLRGLSIKPLQARIPRRRPRRR